VLAVRQGCPMGLDYWWPFVLFGGEKVKCPNSKAHQKDTVSSSQTKLLDLESIVFSSRYPNGLQVKNDKISSAGRAVIVLSFLNGEFYQKHPTDSQFFFIEARFLIFVCCCCFVRRSGLLRRHSSSSSTT